MKQTKLFKIFKSRKSQIEMMGLTVIVVLVSVVFLFFLSFKINQAQIPSEPKQDYTEKQLATNYIQAVLKTTTDCNDLNIQQLLQDCALFRRLDCSMQDSCALINESLDMITNKSLDTWNQAYYFKIQHRSELLYNKSKRGCNEYAPAEATGFQPLTLYPDDSKPILVTLRICKQ